jgi:hypothetical protein
VADTIPTVEGKTWQVRPYRDTDRPSVLRLSAQHYQREGGREEYVDWLVKTAPAGRALVVEATRRLEGEGMALAGSLMLPHTREYRALRAAGYVPAPDPVAPQKFRITATPFREGAYRNSLPSGDRWFVTMADHDAI